MSAHSVSFNSNNLATAVPGLMIVATNPYAPALKKLGIYDVARANKRVVTSVLYNAKKIIITIEIGRTTRELLDASIDTLNSILVGKEKALLLSQGSGLRQYTATLANVIISDVLGGHCKIDLEFECSESFGMDQNNTTLVSGAWTGSPISMPIIVGGTAEWQQPVITITLNSLTGGTSKTLHIENTANSQAVDITRTWSNGDVVVIDSTTKKITVNSAEIEYDGAIPEFEPGSGTLLYSDNLTTRNVSISAVYKKRYI